MSRTPRINPAVAALDTEIGLIKMELDGHQAAADAARDVLDRLEQVRRRMTETAPPRAPRAVKPWKPRGPVEKAIVIALEHGAKLTAEQLRGNTGAAAPSLKAALARMKEAGAVTVGEGDRYSLVGGEIKDAAE